MKYIPNLNYYIFFYPNIKLVYKLSETNPTQKKKERKKEYNYYKSVLKRKSGDLF